MPRQPRQMAKLPFIATVLMAGALGACAATPPIVIPLPSQHIKLSDLWSGITSAAGSATAVIPPLPDVLPQLGQLTGITYLPVPPLAAGLPVNVPSQVKNAPIAAATLNLTATNNYAIPIELKIFLAGTAPYQNDSTPAILEMGAAGSAHSTATATHSVDPAALSAGTLAVGFGLSSAGSGGQDVTFDPSSTVDIESSIAVSFKLTAL